MSEEKVLESLDVNIEEEQSQEEVILTEEEKLKNEIQKLEDENKQLKDKFLRLASDFENTKKRMTKEIDDANKFAVSSFAKSMLEINDILDTAISHVLENDIKENQKFADLFNGLKMSSNEMKIRFEKFSIQKINPLNEKFDYNLHEAVSRIPNEAEIGTIVDVLRCGYSINGRLLRPAMVVVSMGDSN